MKTLSAFRCIVLLVSVSLCVAGCEQQPAARRSAGAPTPTPTPAAPSAERVRQETKQALTTAGEYLKEKAQQLAKDFPREREEWRRKFEEQQRELQPRIDELKRRLNDASEDAKPEIRRQLDNLEGDRQRAAVKLEELKNAGAEAWESFKARWRQEEEKRRAQPTPAPSR